LVGVRAALAPGASKSEPLGLYGRHLRQAARRLRQGAAPDALSRHRLTTAVWRHAYSWGKSRDKVAPGWTASRTGQAGMDRLKKTRRWVPPPSYPVPTRRVTRTERLRRRRARRTRTGSARLGHDQHVPRGTRQRGPNRTAGRLGTPGLTACAAPIGVRVREGGERRAGPRARRRLPGRVPLPLSSHRPFACPSIMSSSAVASRGPPSSSGDQRWQVAP
jgi:hypothetical protein